MNRDPKQRAFRQKLTRSVASSRIVLLIARGLIRTGWAISRLWSHIRFKALVANSGDSVCHWTVEFQMPENITVGERVAIGPHCRLAAGAALIIEDDVTLSRGVILETAGLVVSGDPPYPHRYSPIHIKKGAWLATNAIVLGGVTIGERAIVGAGAVVTKSVPPGTVVVGAIPRSLGAKLD